MKSLTKAKTFTDVLAYVRKFARYYADSPNKRYAVRHPHEYGSGVVFSDDTYDLGVKLAKAYNISIPRH